MEFDFGMYAGCSVQEVPDDYLNWFATKNRPLFEAVVAELERRELMKQANQSLAQRIVEAGYKTLAKQLHPDAGGNGDHMVALNATVERLRDMVR